MTAEAERTCAPTSAAAGAAVVPASPLPAVCGVRYRKRQQSGLTATWQTNARVLPHTKLHNRLIAVCKGKGLDTIG